MREHGSDYFENSRRATYVQQDTPSATRWSFAGYGEHCWGLTACDGPGWKRRGRTASSGSSSTTSRAARPSAPTMARSRRGSSSPRCRSRRRSCADRPQLGPAWILGMTRLYGFKPSFNQTFAVPTSPTGWWVTPYHFGIDQGPVILMIENYRTGLIWESCAAAGRWWPACAGPASRRLAGVSA